MSPPISHLGLIQTACACAVSYTYFYHPVPSVSIYVPPQRPCLSLIKQTKSKNHLLKIESKTSEAKSIHCLNLGLSLYG